MVCGLAKYGSDRTAFPKVLLVPPSSTRVADGDEVLVLAHSFALPSSLDIGDRSAAFDDSLLPSGKLEAKARDHNCTLRTP